MKTKASTSLAGAFRHRIVAALLLALAVSAGITGLQAATATAPNFFTYQGYLADASGQPFAPNGAINYDIVFRIYDDEAAGNLVWAEKQTVTVDAGQFSVLLGEGAANGSDPRPELGTVFASPSASDRYVDLTVTINGNAVTIAPRLRLVSSPYAFLATQATALVSPDGSRVATTGNGAVTVSGTLTAAMFVGNGSQLTGLTASQIPALDAGTITSGTLSTARIPNLDAGKITSGTLSTARIPSLDAAYITSGTLSADRIPGLDAGKITGGVLNLPSTGEGANFFGSLAVPLKVGPVSAGHTSLSYYNLQRWQGTATGPLSLNAKGGDVYLGNASANVYVGNKPVPNAEESLRMVRGLVDSNGATLLGTGYSASRTGTGAYRVTFNPAFTGTPVVTVTALTGNQTIATVNFVNTSTVDVKLYDDGGGAQDDKFNFIALGNR